MKKFILVFVAVSMIVLSCSKDQKVVRTLEGEWEVTGMTYDGDPADVEDYQNTTYTFEKCRVSKGPCDGKMTTIDPSKGEVSYNFTYSIAEKGTEISITLDIFGFQTTTVSEIVESSKTKFVWVSTQDSVEVETTIEKK